MNIKGETEAALDNRGDMKILNIKSVPSGVAQTVRGTGELDNGLRFLVEEETLRGFGLSYRQVIAYS